MTISFISEHFKDTWFSLSDSTNVCFLAREFSCGFVSPDCDGDFLPPSYALWLLSELCSLEAVFCWRLTCPSSGGNLRRRQFHIFLFWASVDFACYGLALMLHLKSWRIHILWVVSILIPSCVYGKGLWFSLPVNYPFPFIAQDNQLLSCIGQPYLAQNFM